MLRRHFQKLREQAAKSYEELAQKLRRVPATAFFETFAVRVFNFVTLLSCLRNLFCGAAQKKWRRQPCKKRTKSETLPSQKSYEERRASYEERRKKLRRSAAALLWNPKQAFLITFFKRCHCFALFPNPVISLASSSKKVTKTDQKSYEDIPKKLRRVVVSCLRCLRNFFCGEHDKQQEVL